MDDNAALAWLGTQFGPGRVFAAPGQASTDQCQVQVADELRVPSGYLVEWAVPQLDVPIPRTHWFVAPLAESRQQIGVIEMVAGVMVAIKPRYAAYVVALWLAGIIINFLTYSGFYDIALRDFGLLVAALTLAALSTVYDRRHSQAHDRSSRESR